ncbi:ATP-dependent RNA helicase HrpA [Verrucomicrobiaceae bacterium SCGC AG-212-N21]|nr:ATP-dependent RNA helicase HrpA [Verrucomicrobiaceae bacterium SCGC AG-212-N21]
MLTIRYPEDLPITARREEIVAAIRQHQVVILAGETGSGKTTQLPKMCLEAAGDQLRGKIGCTQPRRVAAMSVSRRVAEELGAQWGREVGCKMRFNDDTSRDTRVKFMTDGILLAEIQGDPMLRAYSMLILDEAHERSLNIDFLIGYLKGLLVKRPDLKLLVTSATIDTEAFSQHFGGAPIIEVSGRLYPVDIRYAPVPEEDDDLGMIESAVNAVEDALIESGNGDVLVFMPTERDIRETRDLLEGRLGSSYEVMALFGRMPAAEQQRIFAPGPKRRVVVATNVAETSITIPRIRYVVDTGLARVSRYNPRTRTKRLPVEPISQSSANQRAGRAGRVQDGVCIRLYDEEDFEKRPRFTMPEIQRANLAEVILRMKAFRLGEIETFPFINPPVHAAIRSGYELLHELGALGDTHDMTEVGRELARLPVDPTLGRMLLQARKENALAEMLIIAAGLSVPDPRERPEEAKEQAAAAHRAFACPDSDFLSLLRIWKAAPDAESGSRNVMRKFCKTNFLSLTRMREWRDIWRQLRETMDDDREARDEAATSRTEKGSNDDAIHRSVLAGLLGHIALREERNVYKAAGNRQVMVFPGSNLYERREKQGKPVSTLSGDKKPKQPQWIVAGEIVQTSQLFARMVAKIDPTWIGVLGAHLAQYKYSEPHYSAKSGRVLVTQRTIIHGLEVERRHIDFGKVDAVAATQIFIREALVEGELLLNHRFMAHNRKLREKIETTLTRVRSARAWDIAELLQRYYEKRIHGVSSVHDLNRFVQDHGRGNPDYLCATEEDFTGGDELACDLALFPDQVALGNSVLPLSYAYSPGEEQDGVTVQVPLPLAEHLTTAQVQWLVPGLREEQISVLLRALPKALRKSLMPLEPKAREIAVEFAPGSGDFLVALAAFLTHKYGLRVEAADWVNQSLPAHLQPRVEVVDQNKRTVVAGRDLPAIRASVRKQEVRSDAWDRAVKRVERYAVNSWSFGDLPESLVIEEINGVPVLGYPGLALREGEVDLRLFRKKEEVAKSSPAAVRRLAEHALGKDIAWLHQEMRSLNMSAAKPAKPASFQDALSRLSVATPAKPAATVNSPAPLADQAREHILAHVLRLDPVLPLSETRFRTMCEAARKEFPTLAYRVRELLKQIEDLRGKIHANGKRYPGMEEDVARLVPADLLAGTPHSQLQHVPRYLKAIQVRAERAALSPAKDESKAIQIEDFDEWEKHVAPENRETFRWMLEEFRVSIFAPELGTAQKASAKRLEELMTL